MPWQQHRQIYPFLRWVDGGLSLDGQVEDYTEYLKKISVPVLAMNGDGNQVFPYATSGPRAVELVQNGTLKTYAGFPHGMPATHADTINNDLLAFIQS